jgi:F0F1-type ATP synthase assembly protein I
LSGTPKPQPQKPSGAQLSGMGILIAAAMIIPLILGYVVDNFLHTSPFGVLIGLVVGITFSCYVAVAQLRPYV